MGLEGLGPKFRTNPREANITFSLTHALRPHAPSLPCPTLSLPRTGSAGIKRDSFLAARPRNRVRSAR